MPKNDAIIINNGADEIFADWYTCPHCSATQVLYHHKYCHKCGKKLEWDKYTEIEKL